MVDAPSSFFSNKWGHHDIIAILKIMYVLTNFPDFIRGLII